MQHELGRGALSRIDRQRLLERHDLQIRLSSSDIDDIVGASVRSTDDDKVGSVGQVSVDTDGTPVWAPVRTGLFGTSESFVPLHDATFGGKSLQVGYAKDFVEDAPPRRRRRRAERAGDRALDGYSGMGAGAAGPTIDQVVTCKETLPVERIKLGTEQVAEQRRVTEDVRKEQIDLDDPTGTAKQ